MSFAKPRNFQQARATYATNNELAWWVFMRVSGIALIFLTFGHLYMTNILINAGYIDFDFVAGRLSLTWVKVYDTFLLGLALLHGANGLRYSIEDYIAKPTTRFLVKTILYSVVVFVFVFGIISLWAIDYSQFGQGAAAH